MVRKFSSAGFQKQKTGPFHLLCGHAETCLFYLNSHSPGTRHMQGCLLGTAGADRR